LRERAKVIAIKEGIQLCPWADMVYGCDAPWWRYRRGLPNFQGLKVSWEGNKVPEISDLRYLKIVSLQRGKYSNDLQFDEIGAVGSGGNSGFQALNLAAQLGAASIILIGFDMSDAGGLHWYGRNRWMGANNPQPSQFDRWRAAFDAAAPVLKAKGIQVFNASKSSALRCFPFVELEQAFGQANIGVARVRSA
jgi:hypothetical protein